MLKESHLGPVAHMSLLLLLLLFSKNLSSSPLIAKNKLTPFYSVEAALETRFLIDLQVVRNKILTEPYRRIVYIFFSLKNSGSTVIKKMSCPFYVEQY